MAGVARIHRYAYRDYLALEAASNVKHEYLDGEIYAMAGGTPAHAALSVAVASTLLTQLRGGPCRVFSSDLRVRVLATGLATYPDVTVIYGAIEPDPDNPATATNPKLIVEVLSESTIDYDRGEKLDHYRRIPSLCSVVLVSQDERKLELWERTNTDWTSSELESGQTATIPAIGCTLDVAAIFDDAHIAD